MKRLLFILFLFPCFLFGQDRTIDSLKLALKNTKHDTTRCKIYLILGNKYYSEKPDSSIELWQKAKLVAEKNLPNSGALKTTYLKILSKSTGNLGVVYSDQDDIPKALEYYFKSLKIKEEIGDKTGISNSLHNIGAIYSDQGDIPKALDYYHKSITIKEEIGDEKGIAASLNSIGTIYRGQGDISKALEYYLKSLKIQEKIGYKPGLAFSLNNLGVIYSEFGDPSVTSSKEDALRAGIHKALAYHNKSLNIREELEDKKGISGSLHNIGIIYYEKGDPSVTSSKEEALKAGLPKALEYFHKSLKISEEIGNKSGIAETVINLGFIYAKNNHLKEANIYANRSMQLAKELGYPEYIKNSADLLKQIFQKQNKYKEAFEMYELEIKMRDSINNEETQKAAVKKQMQYQYETQARELKNEQDKKDIIAKAELNQKEKQRNYFIVGFALVIVLALFIFRSYRQKQKANVIISQQKHEVEESRKEILDSIHYAKRIQKAHLPTEKQIEKNLNRLHKKV